MSVREGCRSGQASLVVALMAAAACVALRPELLDVPPGHRAVLGRVDLSAFAVSEGILEIVKDDRTFWHDLPVGPGAREFAIALPPGRYRIVRLRAIKDRESFADEPSWNLRLAFEVGPSPAVYIGTLRLASGFGRHVRVSVTDEYEVTLRALRAFYSDLPGAVARSLVVPG